MANILTAIVNIIKNVDNISQRQVQPGNNRANNSGDMLEAFIQDSFANSFGLTGQELTQALNEAFSYLGNKSNPPDMILKNSDAIEVKKIKEFTTNELQLNSSSPKDKIYRDSNLICNRAKTCENTEWYCKDLLYVVGIVPDKTIKRLWFVYGDCFCADKEVYDNVRNRVIEGIKNIEGLEFLKTNELAKIGKIDPLSYTILRVRGMWLLRNPNKIFEEYTEYDPKKDLQIFAIMKSSKYCSLPNDDRTILEKLTRIEDLILPDPNNRAQIINCKLITYSTE